MKCGLAWMAAAAGMVGFFWVFPPFHIVPLQQAQKAQDAAVFDASTYAQKFWQQKLLPETDRAVPLGELLTALAQDSKPARQHYGHSPGLSTTSDFFVKGSGVISAVETESIQVTLDAPPPQA